MKRYICLLLVLVMICALLSGCGEKRKLLGTWECSVDLSQTAQLYLTEKQLASDFEVTDFTVTAQLCFFKNGDFWIQPDQDQLTEQTEALLTKLEEHLLTMLQTQLGELLADISIEELLEMSGFTKEMLTEQLRQQFSVQSLTEYLSQHITLAGCYQVKKEKLLLSTNKEEKLKDHYFVYTLKDNTLTFTEMVGEAPAFVADNVLLKQLPLSFTKLS